MTVEKNLSAKDALLEGFQNHQAGRFSLAKECYRKTLLLEPNSFDANYLLGLIHFQGDAREKARTALLRSFHVDPHHALAAWHLGSVYTDLSRLENALSWYRRAQLLDPMHGDAYARGADVLKKLDRHEDALPGYIRAAKSELTSAQRHIEVANLYKTLGNPEEAIPNYRNAIIIAPESFDANMNLGNALKERNMLKPASMSQRRAIILRPRDPFAKLNLALTRLLQGEYREGWALFESRWDATLKEHRRIFRQPRWTGREDIRGKTLFVHTEQGLGDTLQFCRYLPLLVAQGAHVIFECPPTLRKLLKSLRGPCSLIATGEQIPSFDFYVPLLSLPHAFGTTLENIPNQLPYLSPQRETLERWKHRFSDVSRLKVGLAWSGNSIFQNDVNRSMALEQLTPILELPVSFHALQKDIRAADLESSKPITNLTFHDRQLFDFDDTAALIQQMDLIISVDTSVVHLAGALGKPTWILLPFAPDYRWGLEQETTAWYPTAQLIRQKAQGDWTSVIELIQSALSSLVNNPTKLS